MLSSKKKKGQSGFTLIELLIVVIIVAILAAVGIPLLQGNVQRARMTEADASLGTIRTAMRAELAENAAYPTGASFNAGAGIIAAQIGLNAGDLCGRFFGDANYTFGRDTLPTLFCIRAQGNGADVPAGCPAGPVRGGQVANTVNRSMDQNGHIYTTPDCSGTPTN